MKIRKTRSLIIVAICFCLLWASAATIVVQTHKNLEDAHANQYINPIYAAQPQRNHMVLYNQDAAGLTDQEVAQTAANYNYVNINENDGGGNWGVKTNDAKRIAAKNSDAKVYNYYRLSYFRKSVLNDMGTYAQGFDLGDIKRSMVTDPAAQGWMLRQYVPPSDQNAGGNIGSPLKFDDTQYFIDITNPAYQAWLLPNIVAWVQASNAAGIKFDTTNFLIGNAPPNGGQYRNTTINDLLCGPGIWDMDGSNCPKVAAWNKALQAQIAASTDTFHLLGKQVLYNGIAPGEKRGGNRMLELLTDTSVDGALDEAFCADVNQSLSVKYSSIKDDLDIMANPAYASKKLFFQTNYLDDSKLSLAPYCIGGFLMGWQPGQSYYKFGKVYTSAVLAGQPDPANNSLPHNGIDEIDLNLGNPTAAYNASGSVYSRTFQNGFVAVNDSDSPASIQVPAKMTQFSKGDAGQSYDAGSTVNIAARSGVFFLNNTYLYGADAAGSSGSGQNGTTGDNGADAGISDATGQQAVSGPRSAGGNKAQMQNSTGNAIKRTIVPTLIVCVMLALLTFVLYRRGSLRLRWLHMHHSPVNGPGIHHAVTMMEQPSVTQEHALQDMARPGTVIVPRNEHG